jgi:PEP-CTERM motif
MLFSGASVRTLAVLLAASPAFAAVIYNNGGPNQSGAWAADQSYAFTIAADPFTLMAGASTVSGVQWWGGCLTSSFQAASCPTGNFTIYFYNNNSGIPGSQVASYAVGNAGQSATGNNILISSIAVSTAEYSYTAAIPPLSLTPGTEYWLGVSNNTDPSIIWAMEESSSSGAHVQFSSGDWSSFNTTLAFELTGPATPEPGTLALLSGGAACLIAFRKPWIARYIRRIFTTNS